MDSQKKIIVKYTFKDLKAFVFSITYRGILGKFNYIFSGFILPLLCIVMVLSYIFLIGDNNPLIILPSIIVIIMFVAFTHLPFYLQYYTLKKSMKKNNFLKDPLCFEFEEDKLIISSSKGNNSVLWKDIYKVLELKPCFVIYTSPVKYFIIPRRCLADSEQLGLVFNTLTHNIDKKKLKLKHYPLEKVSQEEPEYSSFETINDASISLEQTPLLQLQVSFTKEEYIAINYKLYYTSPTVIIMAAIGILLIISYIIAPISNGSNALIRLFIGLFLAIILPIMLYFKLVKSFEKDASFKQEYTYSIYEDCYIIQNESTEHRVLWSDLVKAKELKTAFLLYETEYIAQILPKRIFKEDEVKMNILRDRINNMKTHR
ncbi:YcxB family protein [Candidatus Clostridium radicumherbarum]|uniref:YcxB family protein n=1 Tax=Candidatus Clostridium radicumherbarum TaxID=3381662 RepID=A0ABW8TSM7_9CLOT